MSEPGPEPQPDGPAIGQDEWVARHGERRAGRGGWIGQVEERLRLAPWYAWLILFVAAFSALPLVSDSGYVRRVAFDTALYMLLALGLNVVVGWAGLLDLGYVAFYGVGAYAYAILDSGQLGVHLPTLVAIPLVVIIGAVVGFLVGLPSRRLVGDYLAIVTLFFLQIFLTLATNGNSIFGHDITGGANGILNVDPLHLFDTDLAVQHQGIFAVSYLYVAVIVFAVVYTGLHFVNQSRTGRAWRSLREDPLAAEAMGMPVNLLKLTAFSFGAGVAALTGTLFASLNASVFPLTFSFPLLITVYTMVILGGQGSQAGVVIGAVVVSVLLELLRDPGNARLIFYAFGLIAIVFAFGRSRRLAGILAGTLVFGFVAHAIANAIDHSWVSGTEENPSSTADLLTHWVIVPTTQAGWIKPVTYIGLVAVVLLLTLLHGWVRDVLLVPTLYLAAFVWENILLPQPDVTRYIVLGAMLIALMIIRPNGLLGERRVEIVSVIGPNGAGKTTLFNLITGIYEPDAGSIMLGDRSLVGLQPHQITRLGVARTFQTLRLFLNLSVRENVMAAAYGRTKAGILRSMLRTPGMRREEQEIRELAEQHLSFFGERLKGYRWDQPAYSLSYANRRRLEIARAMATGAKFLLLDEPAAGMNPVETHEIAELIARLRDEAGYTILVIEHDMHVVEGISNRVIALDHGVKIVEGTFERVATDPKVIEAYLGTKAAATK